MIVKSIHRPDRRDALRMMGFGAAALAAQALPIGRAHAAATQASLEESFRAAFNAALDNPGAITANRLAFLHDRALVIDHGVPFPMNRSGYADHLAFQTANAQRLEMRFNDLKALVQGNSGIVSAYFIERSKPKDAGFRLRAGYCTAVCVRGANGWKAMSLHMSPLTSQVIDASPG